MKRIKILLAALTVLSSLSSCDEHMDLPDMGMNIGSILLSDGRTISPDFYIPGEVTPVGVIYKINADEKVEGKAFAVSLYDLDPKCFSENLGTALGTSMSVTAFDGNTNTYAMYNAQPPSPIATELFDIWYYRQSAYLPSVAQMADLTVNLDKINKTLALIGGECLSTNPDETWYWTSTEVAGQSSHKAWLYSIASGERQETPKNQAYKSRAVITVY